MLLGSSVKVGGAAAPRRIFALQRAFDLVLRRCLPRKPAVCIDKANECAAGRCASTFASCRLVLPSTNANTAGTRRCGGVFALPCTFRCRCVVNQTCRRPCARTRPPLAPPGDAKRFSRAAGWCCLLQMRTSRGAALWRCFCSAVCLLLQVRGKSHLQAVMCAERTADCAT